MADHERIWLEPECCADPSVGRTWAQDDPYTGRCDDDAKPTQYVRADLYDAALLKLGACLDRLDVRQDGDGGKHDEIDRLNCRLQVLIASKAKRIAEVYNEFCGDWGVDIRK